MATGTYIFTSEWYYPIISYHQNISIYFYVCFCELTLDDEDWDAV